LVEREEGYLHLLYDAASARDFPRDVQEFLW